MGAIQFSLPDYSTTADEDIIDADFVVVDDTATKQPLVEYKPAENHEG